MEEVIRDRNSGKSEPGTSVTVDLCIECNTYRLWGKSMYSFSESIISCRPSCTFRQME